jgi:hypothetical protein
VRRFIEWDSLDVRIDGARLNAMAREAIAGDPTVERIELKFENGLLRVQGAVRKFISVPFSVEIPRIDAKGTTVRVPLGKVSAGPIPVPALLLGLVRNRLPRELVQFEEPATLVISLDRFLPSFVSADIQKIWIINGGLAVTLGRGGADLPAQTIPTGGVNGPGTTV